jgi:hypothetical protein
MATTTLSELIGSEQPRGFTGSQGLAGFTGSIGFTGSTGTSITIVNKVATSNDLPLSYAGSIGDSYVVEDTGFLWVWDGSLWFEAGQFTGYTGSGGLQGFTGSRGFTGSTGFGFTGSRGDTGFTGSIGFTGSQGFTGSIGFTGSQGAGFTGSRGATGFTGSQGLPGAFAGQGFTGSAGTSVKIVGSVATSSALPLPYGGQIADGYITQDTGNLWMWTGSQWINLGPIRGPVGFTGSAGTGSVGNEDWGLITGSLTSSDDYGSIA